MAVRQIYETAFDSTASPSGVDEDQEDEILETSRRLCSPDPATVYKPSPASSRSSTDSDRSSSRKGVIWKSSPRSPALPLKKIFSPWICGVDKKAAKEPDPPTESPAAQKDPAEEKSKTFSPSVEFKKLDVADENKKTISTNDRSPSTANTIVRASKNTQHSEDVLPESLPSFALSLKKKEDGFHPSFCPEVVVLENNKLSRENENGIDFPTTTSTFQPASRISREDMKRSNFECSAATRNNLWLDFSRAPKRPRRHLRLEINGQQDDDNLEPTAHLLKQGWYHGSISRADAENLLRLMTKGSFLVRCSEKLKRQYLLSLKSSRGVMHVKIVQLPNGKYVIKQQTQSFDSIPQLIQYFSTHILNIHEMNVYLSHPVIEKLL
ncbi:uncharacterized protein LOC129230140 [Uloborus diversus]|uniref:uncharacterized protein LOC129230140 n=1 Tax=Uloborus diversus TaxID=327109 RepID=UPI00240A2883|nr:uncharacterized protein LOC129230140 [Uloborus diversus]XP_054720528.1 uncharacterized protein LOC129230140 [Uloborus diversus]